MSIGSARATGAGWGVWNNASNTGHGLLGAVIDRNASGVKGINTNGVGVYGISIAGTGVVGQSDAPSGSFFLGQTGLGERRFRVTTDGQVIANGGYRGDGAGLSNVTATALAPAALQGVWQVGGNTVASSSSFLGTLNDQPVNIRAGDVRVLRLEPDPRGWLAGNVIGGYSGNTIRQPGSGGNTIAGGGSGIDPNVIDRDSAGVFIGAGSANQVGPEVTDVVIGGGLNNHVLPGASRSVIGGGEGNVIWTNAAGATIPGGTWNEVSAPWSFAAGTGAKVVHPGSFAWADARVTVAEDGNRFYEPLWTARTNEFLIRAQNGLGLISEVGIHLDATDGPLIVRDWDVFDATAPGGKAGIGRWGLFQEPFTLTVGIPGDDVPNRFFQVAKYATDGTPTPLLTVDQSGTVTANRFVGDASGLSGTVTNLLNYARGYYETPFAVYSSGLVTNLNAQYVGGLSADSFWQLGGNAHTSGLNFLGTWENQPLELMTYGTRTLRLEPDARGLGSGNLIGGNSYNAILQPGSGGCVIGGGGLWESPNIISSNSSGVFLGAGSGNNVGAYAQDSVIVGGRGNRIAGTNMYSIIVGGQANVIGPNSRQSTISGGVQNNVGSNSTYSTIAGGGYNWIRDNVEAGTIPGGSMNTVGVGASFALAAGHQARANHPGTFVWADSQTWDFNSARTNEFLVRAQNGLGLVSGVGIHLNGADAPLIVRDWDVFDASAPNGKGGIGRWGLFMEPNNIALGMPANGSGSIRFGKYATDGTFTSLADVGQNGDFHIAGTYYPSSDRNVKQNLAPVNLSEVLAKVAALPVQTWSYTNSPTARHIGPMAQDFRAAFGLGEDDKHIATIDSDGVALAAIQGLNRKLEEQLKAKDAELSELRRRLDALEQRLAK